MRCKYLFFGIAVSALTIGSIYSTSIGQEEGRRGGGDRGGAPGGGGRGGPPGGGFTGRGGGGGGIMGLLRVEEVQKELELTDEQKKDLMAMADRMRESFASMLGGGATPGQGGRPGSGRPEGGGRPEGSGRPEGGGRPQFSEEQMKEFQARAAETRAKAEEARNKAETEIMTAILDPIQGDRILGLLIQKEDGASLSSNPLAETLGLTPEQKQKVKTVSDNNSAERMKMMQSAFGGGGGFSQEVRDQMDGLTKKMNSELIAVMTPDQKAKFEAMKGEKFTFPESRGFGGPGGGTRGGPPGEGGTPREGGRPARPSGPNN